MIGWQQMVGPANPPPKSLLWSWLFPDGEEGTGKLADSALSPRWPLPTVPVPGQLCPHGWAGTPGHGHPRNGHWGLFHPWARGLEVPKSRQGGDSLLRPH